MMPWRIFTLLIATMFVAGPSEAQIGGWVSANAVSVAPAAKSTTQEDAFPYFGETFRSSAVYTAKTKGSFDVGAGVLFRQFGVGIAVSGYSDSEPAAISFSVPDKRLFNRIASGSGTTGQLKNDQTAVHIEARYIANRPHFSVAVFAGPTLFKANRELIDDFTYREVTFGVASTPSHTVEFLSDTHHAVSLSAWGFNVGTDVGYFFTEKAGVGALVRFSRAQVDVQNLLAGPTSMNSGPQAIDLGGLSLGAGIRLRF